MSRPINLTISESRSLTDIAREEGWDGGWPSRSEHSLGSEGEGGLVWKEREDSHDEDWVEPYPYRDPSYKPPKGRFVVVDKESHDNSAQEKSTTSEDESEPMPSSSKMKGKGKAVAPTTGRQSANTTSRGWRRTKQTAKKAKLPVKPRPIEEDIVHLTGDESD